LGLLGVPIENQQTKAGTIKINGPASAISTIFNRDVDRQQYDHLYTQTLTRDVREFIDYLKDGTARPPRR
jgi:hypothetical protein